MCRWWVVEPDDHPWQVHPLARVVLGRRVEINILLYTIKYARTGCRTVHYIVYRFLDFTMSTPMCTTFRFCTIRFTVEFPYIDIKKIQYYNLLHKSFPTVPIIEITHPGQYCYASTDPCICDVKL